MEESRNTRFAERLRTRIWEEIPDPKNPWVAQGARCHGYAHEEMIDRLDYPQTIYLLLRGEIPDTNRHALLQRFLVAFCNPGPRHGATRATMSAAASGTRTRHLASIGMALLGGEHLGSAEVESAASFIARHRNEDPAELAARLLMQSDDDSDAGDRRIAPGFGTLYGELDPRAMQLAQRLAATPGEWPNLDWGQRFAHGIGAGHGWLEPGVAAAVGLDLGFAPRTTGVLYQIAALPGLLAHGLEAGRQGMQAFPFVADDDYEFIDPRFTTAEGTAT